MIRKMLKCKIHRATVTAARLEYEGSITIDKNLCKKAELAEFEQVDVYNCNNGARFTTYVIYGGKNEVCVNGAAARLAYKGDKIIIVSYAGYSEKELEAYKPKIILLK